MTSASGLPYNNHGQPRMPTQPMAGQFTNFMQQPPPQVLPPTPGPQVSQCLACREGTRDVKLCLFTYEVMLNSPLVD